MPAKFSKELELFLLGLKPGKAFTGHVNHALESGMARIKVEKIVVSAAGLALKEGRKKVTMAGAGGKVAAGLKNQENFPRFQG